MSSPRRPLHGPTTLASMVAAPSPFHPTPDAALPSSSLQWLAREPTHEPLLIAMGADARTSPLCCTLAHQPLFLPSMDLCSVRPLPSLRPDAQATPSPFLSSSSLAAPCSSLGATPPKPPVPISSALVLSDVARLCSAPSTAPCWSPSPHLGFVQEWNPCGWAMKRRRPLSVARQVFGRMPKPGSSCCSCGIQVRFTYGVLRY